MLNATGYVMAAHKIELASKVVGRVAWVGVEMGDKIEQGPGARPPRGRRVQSPRRAGSRASSTTPRRCSPSWRPARGRRRSRTRQATLDQAQAELTNAEINLKRLQELEGSTVVSQAADRRRRGARAARARRRSRPQQQQYELAKAGPRKEQIDAQRATVRQLEGALAMAMIDLDNTVIRSPIAATVLERNVEVGEFVTTGFVGDRGAKGYVVSIADLNDLRVELDISQNDFAKVAPKQPCWIVTDAYPGQEIPRRRRPDLAGSEPPEGDGAGAREGAEPGRAAQAGHERDGVVPLDKAIADDRREQREHGETSIRIPNTALREDNVFVVEDGKAVQRTLQLGQKFANGDVEVRKGLIGGEDLIVSPPSELKDGVKVKTE